MVWAYMYMPGGTNHADSMMQINHFVLISTTALILRLYPSPIACMKMVN